MKDRKNYLAARRNIFRRNLLGCYLEEECSNCGKQTIFMFHRYDASGCLSCDEWLDAACGDPECPYCGNRPATPCEAFYLADTEAGSAGARKEWRRKNYQHKTDGAKKHDNKRKSKNFIK